MISTFMRPTITNPPIYLPFNEKIFIYFSNIHSKIVKILEVNKYNKWRKNMPKEVNPDKNHNVKDDTKNAINSKWGTAIISGLIGAGLVGGVSAYANQDKVSEDEVKTMVERQVNAESQNKSENKGQQGTQQASVEIQSDVSAVVDKVAGSVVSVVNLASPNNQVYDLFGFTQPSRNSDELKTASEGSGVIYKVHGDKAYIVTNNHVIKGSDALEIILADGTQVPVDLVGADPWTDLAVLAMPAEYAKTVAEFGDSSQLKVGEPAIAIGSPLGSDFASTVTSGIVSGLNRQVPTDLDEDGQSDWTVTAIQTDAAINPGNSGGALVNSAGQVIGINSMKISTAQVEGMGFAIPSNDVTTIISQLEKDGHVTRPGLGLRMASLYQFPLERQKQMLKLPEAVEDGVVVMEVDPNSPADQAGLKQYDVITRFGDHEIKDTTQLRQALYGSDPNGKVEIEYYRNGKKQTTTVQLRPQDHHNA